jgi:hypothetical protein
MDRIIVVNYKSHTGGKRGEGELIMRGTPLGNPNTVEKHGREKAIALFEADLHRWLHVEKRPDKRAEMTRLYNVWQREGKLTLICACVPRACHGDIIKAELHAIHERR